MNTTGQGLEQEFRGLLETQRALYRQAFALLEPAGAQATEQQLNDLLEQLNRLMDRASANERTLRDRWAVWQAAGKRSTADLHDSWQATESELKRLIERVEAITIRAQSVRDAMLPNLASGQAHYQMRAAYGRVE